MECTILEDQEELKLVQEETKPIEQRSSKESDGFWVVHVDWSSSSTRSGAGLLLLGLEGFVAEYTLRFDFSAINNEAEYEALVVGLRIARELGVQKLRIRIDLQLVAGQVKGDYET